MRLVCISDTHGDHELVTLPEGDVLIHAGDISAHGTADDTRKFIDWFGRQAFKHHILSLAITMPSVSQILNKRSSGARMQVSPG